jgi:hypothetical protein
MRTPFRDFTTVDYQNLIGTANGAETMRYHETGTPIH